MRDRDSVKRDLKNLARQGRLSWRARFAPMWLLRDDDDSCHRRAVNAAIIGERAGCRKRELKGLSGVERA